MFGTVIDWQRGLLDSIRSRGGSMTEGDFDRIIDAQAEAERGPFRAYTDILASSLIASLGMDRTTAASIAKEAGRWPLFPDARAGLRRLMLRAACVAMSNSDLVHAKQVQSGLGFRLSGWISSEAVRAYKPDPAFWRHVAARRGVAFGPDWWHVSAYADYDLVTARRLGLTCVFVERPHARAGGAGGAALTVRALDELAGRLAAL